MGPFRAEAANTAWDHGLFSYVFCAKNGYYVCQSLYKKEGKKLRSKKEVAQESNAECKRSRTTTLNKARTMFVLFINVYLLPLTHCLRELCTKNVCYMNEWNVTGSQQEIN